MAMRGFGVEWFVLCVETGGKNLYNILFYESSYEPNVASCPLCIESSPLRYMPRSSNFQNTPLQSFHKRNHYPSILQLPPPYIFAYEFLRLLDSHIDNFNRAAEPQDPLHTGCISAQSLVAWLHGRVQDGGFR